MSNAPWLEARAAFDTRVLGIVRERGPLTSRDVRNAIGFDGQGHAYEYLTVGGALKRLQRAGLVTSGASKKVGSRVRYSVATAVSA